MRTSTFTRALAAVGAGAVVLHGVRFGMEAFGAGRPFGMQPGSVPLTDSPEFAGRLACITNAGVFHQGSFTVLKNGVEFYPAELAAIDAAERSINLLAYEFDAGDFTRELVRRLTEKAKNGVEVRVLVDAIGSFHLDKGFFHELIAAGGRFAWFHPVNLRQWVYFDHRSHRKLLIVDGHTGFIGGADFSDHWVEVRNGRLPWRDTVFRAEGDVVRSLTAAFAQNWVESAREILFSDAHFPAVQSTGQSGCKTTGLVVSGRAGYGASDVRVLFQTLIDSARSSIQITTPYFLPGHSSREALTRAAARGVKVQVITAGRWTDHSSVRRLSEAMSVKLVRSGVEVSEYQPSMIHAKLMTIDGVWSVGGSTNFDHRSFALNDEVNLAIFDRAIAATLEQQFQQDLSQSRQLTLQQLGREGVPGKAMADASWLLRREE